MRHTVVQEVLLHQYLDTNSITVESITVLQQQHDTYSSTVGNVTAVA